MEWYEIPVDTLRTMSDDILELSHFGLSSDYAYISKGYKHLKDREKTIGLYINVRFVSCKPRRKAV